MINSRVGRDASHRTEMSIATNILTRIVIATIAAVMLMTTACTEVEQEVSDIFIAPEVFDLGDGKFEFADRGFLMAPENRSKADSQTIAVHFMRFRSTADDPGTPIFMLAGGPGGSWIPALTAGTEGVGHPAEGDLAIALAILEDLRSVGDVVVIDQRGAGLSIPQMDCPNHQQPAPADELFSAEAASASLAKYARDCKQLWIDQGRDIDGYHALELADDIDDLRRALGYANISLYGGSFGSEWGFVTLRRHPEIIERVAFRGLEGINHTFDMPTGTLTSIKAILAEAEKDPELSQHVPEGGFLAAIGKLIEQLAENPEIVPTTDPLTGETIQVIIGADELRRSWRGGGGRVGTQDWPASLLPILNGDLSSVAARVARNKGQINRSSTGNKDAMSYAIDCGLSPTAARREQLVSDKAIALIGNINLGYFAVCGELAAANVSEEFLTTIQTDTPALFIHGTWDTSTPLMNALEGLTLFAH